MVATVRVAQATAAAAAQERERMTLAGPRRPDQLVVAYFTATSLMKAIQPLIINIS